MCASWRTGSSFTSGLHPPDATPQGLMAYLYRPWRFPLMPSPRLVAHLALQLPLQLGEEAPLGALRDELLAVGHVFQALEGRVVARREPLVHQGLGHAVGLQGADGGRFQDRAQ